jgi:hypothetical protein
VIKENNMSLSSASVLSTLPAERSGVASTVTSTGVSKLKLRVNSADSNERKRILDRALSLFIGFVKLRSDEFSMDELDDGTLSFSV